MPRTSALFSIIILFTVSACDAAVELPTPPSAISLLRTGPEIFATGSGLINFSPTLNAPDARFVFDVSNGTVQGKFSQRRERNGLIVDFSGVVTCLTIDSALGRARIGGVITQNNSTDPAFLTSNHEIGDDVWFRVQDGEGHGTVDASTTYGFKPTLVNTSVEYCALPFTGTSWNLASIWPLRSGSILIRP